MGSSLAPSGAVKVITPAVNEAGLVSAWTRSPGLFPLAALLMPTLIVLVSDGVDLTFTSTEAREYPSGFEPVVNAWATALLVELIFPVSPVTVSARFLTRAAGLLMISARATFCPLPNGGGESVSRP